MNLPMCLPYSIIVADDHASFRRGITRIIEETPGLRLLGEAEDGADLERLLQKATPDLLVLDIAMPQFRAMEATATFKRQYPGIKVLIMCMDAEREYLTHAMAAGAEGIVLKQDAANEFLTAVTAIRRKGKYWPPQMLKELSAAKLGNFTYA